MLLLLFDKAIIGIGLWLVTQLFKVAAFSFKIFMLLAQNDVLTEIDYSNLITNFYVIIGIAMLFIMAFALLRGIVNPDDQKQGTTVVKNIIINFVLSVIMLGFLPTIFPFIFDLQDAILRYNVIGGFFGYGQVGTQLTDNTNVNDVEAGAYRLVNGVFTAFFNVSDGYCTEQLAGQTFETKAQELEKCQQSLTTDAKLVADGDDHDGAATFIEFKQHVDETADFGAYSAFIDQAADDNISFNFIVLLIAGVALIYVGISYCFDMGLRLIKLIFYQVLAPIPIFLRVIPNSKFSGTFNQWLKVTLTCWMEVFVRIFIFSFCMWLCTAIMSTNFLSSNVYEYGRMTGLFTKAFILMAIVMFMKRSPKLLSEITGIDSGNMKLGIREKLAEGGGLAAGAAVGAGATVLTRNAANAFQSVKNANGGWAKTRAVFGGIGSMAAGGLSGFVRGGKSGISAKNFSDAKKAASTGATGAVEKRAKRANYRAAHGGTLFGATMGHVKDFGRSARNYVFDQSVEGLSRESQSMSKLASSYSSFSDGIESLLEKEQSKGGGSVFNGHGFKLQNYKAFDEAAQRKRDIQAKFQSGQMRKMELRDKDGKIIRDANGNIMYEATARAVTEEDLRMFEKDYSDARDVARDELMDLALAGTKNNAAYNALDEKAKAAMQSGMLDAERLQATVLENANTKVVQDIMGVNGSNALSDIANNKPLTTKSFENPLTSVKLKDAVKVEQGRADIKIAEMNKESAAKGDKK